MKFKENIIEIGSCKTFYWQTNLGAEQTLVLLHGFPGNHKVVFDMAKNLPENLCIIIPDMPACGKTDSLKDEHILKNYAKWLCEFLENISVKKSVVVGYSFGSRVAVTFADIYPEKVEKLALITPVVKFDSYIARLASLEFEIAEKLPAFMKKTWLSNRIYHGISNKIIFKSASKKRRQHLIANDAKEIKHLDPRANLELYNELADSKPISQGNKINLQTLIIAADKDEIATLNSVKELCARFVNCELKIVKNSGHIVVAERPKKIAKIIGEWLRK